VDVDGLSGLDNIQQLGTLLQQSMNNHRHLLHDDDEDITCE